MTLNGLNYVFGDANLNRPTRGERWKRTEPYDKIVHSDFSPRDIEEERLRLYLRDHMRAAELLARAKRLARSEDARLERQLKQRLFDRPYTDYLRTLKREQEERLGRIETVQPEPARPAGDAADGRWTPEQCKAEFRRRAHGLNRLRDDGTWARGDWSC